MKNQIVMTLILFILAFIQLSCEEQMQVSIKKLLCEYQENPVGIGTEQPCFSWILTCQQRGQAQMAYQILVSTEPENLLEDTGDVWDSGKVESSQSSHIQYRGEPLVSNKKYYWKVRVWDKNGNSCGFSPVAEFTTALLQPEDWQAQWISAGTNPEVNSELGYYNSDTQAPEVTVDARSTLLRKKINLAGQVKSARVFVSGLGYYELLLNGEKVGKSVLNPAKTPYRKQVLYDAYEVTELLKKSELTIGIHLGNGWFNPLKKWWSWRMQWYGDKRAIFQLHLVYADGSTETIVSDETWKAAPGPVVSSCVYDGEIYDARLEQPDWVKFDFDDSAWQPVKIVAAPGGKMISQQMEPIEITEILKPVNMASPDSGVFVFDMGQNFAGWVRLKVKGQAGDQVTLRFAENIHPNGNIDTYSNNLAEPTDVYLLKGKGTEFYEPRFTFHGFRYVEVTGFPGTPTLENLEGRVVHSACAATGKFETSNPRLNRIHKCTHWSQRSNLVGFPMDCPQRDERLGWMGDAHVTAEEAMLNFHTPLFYRNWLSGILVNQKEENGDIPYISPRPFTDGAGTPAWSSAYVLLTWYHYLHYGDKRVLQEHYSGIKKYVEFLRTQAKNHIQPPDKYGDWCSANATGWWQRGKPDGVSTCYYFYNTMLLSRMAQILGEEADAQKYTQLAEQIKQAYHQYYFKKETRQYEEGSQCSNAFPLFLGIVPVEQLRHVLGNLLDDILKKNEGHLSTGILGTKYMLELLSMSGHGDIAYLLTNQTGYPSWDDMIKNRTTLSEHWNHSVSNNHVMFGSVDTWFYRYLAGIQVDPAGPGFEKIVIKPYIPPQLSFVHASVQTMKGEIVSEWECQEDEFRLKVKIPVNTTALVYVLGKEQAKITENGSTVFEAPGVNFIRVEAPYVVFQVAAGNYEFISKNVKSLISLPYVGTPVITPGDSVIYLPDSALVEIQSATPGAEIYYTLDGREPTENDRHYTGPFVLSETSEITARAFKASYQSSFRNRAQLTFIDPEQNGVKYKFFKGSWENLPEFKQLEPDQVGKAFQFDLTPFDTQKHYFAVEFSAFLQIVQPGKYTFFTQSNDGSQLFINNKLIVNNDELHGVQERQGTVKLNPGKYPVRVTYFQGGGSKKLKVFYEGPSFAKTEISASRLFLEK